ncbi:DNA polymerase IV (DinB-like DNA polymerase) [Halohasta litchfieldiae]|jgi:DNA polymerase IV (DinB-like DNA polymerase)|uniref:DNA polymerase IV n=1 Tax=Halohasta litchfieldiae TaxID=1073996 RepID=A0A1H6UN16_9EURY|nr:DNA polymerase IV [Halohasta litchfieldiae]ATW89498.1 DNA polymerase IV (DinB-like DNA polymerase) [Halohasta litchfieldiae]SEI93689.1 DNA polymerase IV (DinB-like DNA polymerase) [Halohasta litchfieldiae]
MDGQLPGATVDSEDRIILHVDMDCFYASCERLREPALEGKPVVVGMGYEPGEGHGAVATASYEAREYGVESAQAIGQALDALPHAPDVDDDHDGPVGFYRSVDMDFYKSVAGDVKEILHDHANTVREVSIDEAYLDVTNRTSWDPVDSGDRTIAEGYGRHIKQQISREVGVPASVGVAPNMSTAKIASDFDKPNGLTVVRPTEVSAFLDPLPVDEIHGVGPVTARELRDLSIETAGDLADADQGVIVDQFGQRGRELYARARGEDDREVTPQGRPKSLSRESAFTESTADSEAKREKVGALAADVAARAQSRGAMYRTIGIKVVTPPFDVNTRASSLSGPVDEPDLVESVALDLLTEFADDKVRKLGVRVSNLDFEGQDQARLDGFESTGGGGAIERDVESVETVDTSGGQITDWVEEGESTESDTKRRVRDGQSSLGEFE